VSFSEVPKPWAPEGACNDLAQDVASRLFVHPANDTEKALAKAICGNCVVRAACADHALGIPPEAIAGEIWGGMDRAEITARTRA